MTSPVEPASTETTPARQLTRPLREPAAFVLLGANALLLFAGLLRLMTSPISEAGYAGNAAAAFTSIEAVVLPLLAVLLATHLHPVLPRAKLITQVALGQYAFSAFFGALIFVIWSVDRLVSAELLDAFLGFLSQLAGLGLLLLAGFPVYRIWRQLYYVPKPKPQPGVYGAPPPGWPVSPPGGQPGSQPGWPAPGPGGWPGPNQGAGWPGPSQGDGWPAPPQSGAVYGQSAAPHAGAFPPAAPHAGAFPPAAPHAGASPPAQPSAEPTQAIPRQSVEPQTPSHDEDRTRPINPSDSPD
ncbi:hypothetical protein [Salinispora tropica]|uniref:Uncharacterized protein n=1 Tax=Salinispora tropica (strain ATCC BAA-916 / DSM 44818 / JCM 13857 / NBRC 105044 / CNB-440) TaxID=369723 RepID=A4X3H2_SALTO|nr:hypothetical protein [Salinispora tropica]ABP53422.1 hypothetical protein Strop_0945 [Salinispora tropica CNB-440]